ncbi:MAG: acetolactate synthase, partial [Verrucomicrobia bacterium]|nr:acetolactate synthase [Verrucomicrobiota bacterium]
MSTATPPQNSPTQGTKDIGPLMFGRDIFVEALEREGCEVIFAYPGGARMD